MTKTTTPQSTNGNTVEHPANGNCLLSTTHTPLQVMAH